MKLVKSHYKWALTDEHLQLIFIEGYTNFEHHLSEMLSLHQKKRIPFADLLQKIDSIVFEFCKKKKCINLLFPFAILLPPQCS